MENKSNALAAGAFVLLVTALLVAMAVWLMRDQSEQRPFEISTREGVSGLQPQAGVRYKGVLVGRVTAIALDTQARGNVLLRIAVNDSAPITTTTYASLGFQGVTGLAFIQLDDSAEDSPPLQSATGAPARIPMRPGLVSSLTDQGTQLIAQLKQASERVNSLLAADNQKNLMAAVANLGQAAASIGQLSKRADAVLAGTGGPGSANLPQVAQQVEVTLRTLRESADVVRSSAAEFRRMSARMNEPDGTLDKINRSTDALVTTGQNLNTSVVPRLNHTADEAARAARQVGRLAEGLSDNPQALITGKGAVPPGPGEAGFSAPQPSAPVAP